MAVKKWIGGTNGSANDLSVASNYVPSGVPAAGDDLYVEANPSGTNFNITAGLSTFAGITLNSLNVSQTFTANIGIANTGTSSTMTGYMDVGGTNSSAIAINVGYQYGGSALASGSNLLRISSGSRLATVTVTNTGASSQMANAGPLTLLGTHSSNTLNITSGIVSIAIDPSEVSTYRTINSGGSLAIGTGVTLTAINQSGTLLIQSAVSTINNTAGIVSTVGSGAIATFNLQGGTGILNSTGTITALNVYNATANLSGNPAPRTITTLAVFSGATVNLNNGVKNSITITNPIVTNASPKNYSVVPWFGSSIAFS